MAYECANPTILEPLAYVILSLLGLSLSHSATVDRNGAIPKSPLLVYLHQLDFSFNSNFNPWGCLIPLRHTHSHIVHKVFINFVILNNMKFLLSVLAVFAFVAYANCGKARPSNRFEWFSFCFYLIFFLCLCKQGLPQFGPFWPYVPCVYASIYLIIMYTLCGPAKAPGLSIDRRGDFRCLR